MGINVVFIWRCLNIHFAKNCKDLDQYSSLSRFQTLTADETVHVRWFVWTVRNEFDWVDNNFR